MFYTTINIIVINLFLLSLHVPIAKKDKFIKYITFRETLYRGLFNHITGVVNIGRADILSLIKLFNAAEALYLPIIEDTGGASIKHQRIRIKRGPCVIYK